MIQPTTFYRVTGDLSQAPLRDYLLHGFESRRDFYQALRRLANRWQGKVGERINERHGFLLLRFHDTPGGKPDEEWFPHYLLQPAETPDYLLLDDSDTSESTEEELRRAFGFD